VPKVFVRGYGGYETGEVPEAAPQAPTWAEESGQESGHPQALQGETPGQTQGKAKGMQIATVSAPREAGLGRFLLSKPKPKWREASKKREKRWRKWG
jgi:hypothetical protein